MKVRRWLYAVIASTFLLIVWGAVVRRAGAGLGCPDWPLCYGTVLPPFSLLSFIEYFHRLLAGVVVIVTIGMLIAVRKDPATRSRLSSRALGALALLLVQAGMGGVTVKSELHPHVVATHLMLAWIFMAVILRMAIRLKAILTGAEAGELPLARPQLLPRGARIVGWIALALLLLQGALGAIVSTSHAGLACPDFPKCQGLWMPPMIGAVATHMSHRFMAILVTLMIGAYAGIGSARSQGVPAAKKLFRLISWVLLLQLALGITNIWTHLSFAVDIAHLAIATLLWMLMILSLRTTVPTSSVKSV